MDAAIAFAQNVVNISYEDIGPDVLLITKRSILDTLGVMLAASTASAFPATSAW